MTVDDGIERFAFTKWASSAYSVDAIIADSPRGQRPCDALRVTVELAERTGRRRRQPSRRTWCIASRLQLRFPDTSEPYDRAMVMPRNIPTTKATAPAATVAAKPAWAAAVVAA